MDQSTFLTASLTSSTLKTTLVLDFPSDWPIDFSKGERYDFNVFGIFKVYTIQVSSKKAF